MVKSIQILQDNSTYSQNYVLRLNFEVSMCNVLWHMPPFILHIENLYKIIHIL